MPAGRSEWSGLCHDEEMTQNDAGNGKDLG